MEIESKHSIYKIKEYSNDIITGYFDQPEVQLSDLSYENVYKVKKKLKIQKN